MSALSLHAIFHMLAKTSSLEVYATSINSRRIYGSHSPCEANYYGKFCFDIFYVKEKLFWNCLTDVGVVCVCVCV